MSKQERQQKSHRLQVLITERLAAEIRSAAERRRMSGGEWVRHAIERALAEERGESDALSALSRLGAPTGDIEQILAEIEAGRTGEE